MCESMVNGYRHTSGIQSHLCPKTAAMGTTIMPLGRYNHIKLVQSGQ